jgi:hypothetical protein
MAGSAAIGNPVPFERIRWLFVEAQAISLAVGAAAILLRQRNRPPLPAWRRHANTWIGRLMAALIFFYVIAFILIAHRGN